MAFADQKLKVKKAPLIEEICKKYGVTASLAVRSRITLVLNIKSGEIDFLKNCKETCRMLPRGTGKPRIPKYHFEVFVRLYDKHFSGTAKKFLEEILQVMNDGNYDRSNIQADYYDVGWFTEINIGRWDTPYSLITK